MNLVKSLALGTGAALVTLALICTVAFASPHLTCDPQEAAEYYKIRVLNDTPEATDDQVFTFNALEGGVLMFDLVNFPAGENNIMVLAGNVWEESAESPYTFDKVMPGISTNMALVNIDGVAYLVADAQEGVIQYRIIIDGTEYFIDAEADGSLKVSLAELEDGIHSIELYAIGMWGESNPAPFGFTKVMPNAPQSLHLIQ